MISKAIFASIICWFALLFAGCAYRSEGGAKSPDMALDVQLSSIQISAMNPGDVRFHFLVPGRNRRGLFTDYTVHFYDPLTWNNVPYSVISSRYANIYDNGMLGYSANLSISTDWDNLWVVIADTRGQSTRLMVSRHHYLFLRAESESGSSISVFPRSAPPFVTTSDHEALGLTQESLNEAIRKERAAYTRRALELLNPKGATHTEK